MGYNLIFYLSSHHTNEAIPCSIRFLHSKLLVNTSLELIAEGTEGIKMVSTKCIVDVGIIIFALEKVDIFLFHSKMSSLKTFGE